jgi:hypothetical protein
MAGSPAVGSCSDRAAGGAAVTRWAAARGVRLTCGRSQDGLQGDQRGGGKEGGGLGRVSGCRDRVGFEWGGDDKGVVRRAWMVVCGVVVVELRAGQRPRGRSAAACAAGSGVVSACASSEAATTRLVEGWGGSSARRPVVRPGSPCDGDGSVVLVRREREAVPVGVEAVVRWRGAVRFRCQMRGGVGRWVCSGGVERSLGGVVQAWARGVARTGWWFELSAYGCSLPATDSRDGRPKNS